MTIKKPATRSVVESNQTDIERVINAGSPPPDSDRLLEKEVKFQMVISPTLCKIIDKERKLTKTSRRAWILQSVQEKLEREGKLPSESI